MKKLITCVIVFVVLFGGYYFFTNSSKQETFNDSKYGFEIKIPSSWSGSKSVNEKGQTVYKLEDKNNPTAKIGINVPVDSTSRPNTSASPTQETINGYSTDHYIIAEGSMDLYVINHNNEILWMLLSYTSDTKDAVKQIVSTFKYN